ncbi:MAG: GIY-YIG nuclease family protein [Phycisphaerales bacterium]|nr:GIY-YIG nuclease family protein [Phycisphaerales bacterium]
MPFFVYVLRSDSTGRRYVGQTSDLQRRVAEHNDHDHNPSKFTSRNPGPWLLVYSEQRATRSEAMQREKWLKTSVGRAR